MQDVKRTKEMSCLAELVVAVLYLLVIGSHSKPGKTERNRQLLVDVDLRRITWVNASTENVA